MIKTNSDDNHYDYSIYYRIWHDESDKHADCMAAFHRDQLRSFLPPPVPCSVLDIGCGMGFTILALRELGFSNLYGIDTDREQVASCVRRGLPVECVDDTVSFLQCHPEEFDLILMLDVLEHIPVNEQIQFLRAVHRSVRPAGRVILTVPNASSILAYRWRYSDYTHHSSFTEHSLGFVLKNAGFEQIIIPSQNAVHRPSLRLWKRVARIAFLKWIVRSIWRMVMTVEIGGWERINDISLELNLITVAFKSNRQKGLL